MRSLTAYSAGRPYEQGVELSWLEVLMKVIINFLGLLNTGFVFAAQQKFAA